MALGISQDVLDDTMQELQSLAPGDLQALIEEQQGDLSDIPEGHLINYAEECRKESYEAQKIRRDRWTKMYEAHESELMELADKEDWQSKIVLNKPFTTVVQAQALIRRALMERSEYFTLDPADPKDPAKKVHTTFWKKALTYWLSTQDANMPMCFADMSHMGFTLGTSSALKIMWQPDDNGIWRLVLKNISPWSIYDDPDRESRKPWSGLYYIEEEYIDYHNLLERAEEGYYDLEAVKNVKFGHQGTDTTGYTLEDKENQDRRKQHDRHQNRFRKPVLLHHFWGTILDENGERMMHNARFVVANHQVVRRPKPVPFTRLRWPYAQFAPLPHLMNRFHGYGLYEGVMGIWRFQNALLNLFIDNENWRINNMFERDKTKLEDPTDTEAYPGKMWDRKRNAAEGPALTPLLKGQSNIQDFSVLWDVSERNWQEGSLVTEPLRSERNTTGRDQRTLGEIQMKFEQSMGVFDSVGKDVEQGGVDAIWAIKEVLTTFWDDFDQPSIAEVMGLDSPEYLAMQELGHLHPQERIKQMQLDSTVKISGISRLVERSKLIETLGFLVQVTDNPRFTAYSKDYELVKRIYDEVNQSDLVMSEQEKAMLDQIMARQEQAGKVSGAVDSALAVAGVGQPANSGGKGAQGNGAQSRGTAASGHPR